MTGFRGLFRLSGREPEPAEDIAQEFAAHLQLKADALVREGLSQSEAQREAERRFGPISRFAEECRDIDGQERRERQRREWWSAAFRDLVLALRSLRRSPAFAATALLVLATGIGLNATMFTVLRGVVLRPLPFPESDRLVALYSSNPAAGWPTFSVSPTDFFDWTRDARSFSSLVALSREYKTITGSGPADQVPVVFATAGLGAVTGVSPALGRSFASSDFETGAPRVSIISHETWTARFGGDRSTVGKSWVLDGESHQIVGIMPPGFAFPVEPAAAWVAFRTPADLSTQRGAHYVDVVGRLAPGATLAGARGEMATLAARTASEFPKSSAGWTVVLRTLHDDVVEEVRPTLLLLMTGVGLLLVLACANVANLVLVRSIGRSAEVAVRSALGASKGRLLWHGASEILVLVILGAVAAIPIAVGALTLVHQIAPGDVPRLAEVGLDPVAVVFTLGVTALTALLVGIAPARRIARVDLRTALAGAGSRNVGPRRGSHRWLVGVETAMALALLVVAGVLLKSMQRLTSVDPGLDRQSTLVAGISLSEQAYPTGVRISQFQDELLARLSALPGVESAALVFGLPLTNFRYSSSFTIDSVPVPDGVSQSAQLRLASPGYFATQKIPLIAGRVFTAEDRHGAQPVVIVNEAAVKAFWPEGRPLGHWVRISARPGPDDDRPMGEIVGVVADIHDRGLDRVALPTVYASTGQVGVGYATIVLRTSVPPLTLAAGLRRIVVELDPDIPLSEVRSMDEVVRQATAAPRFRAWLMGFFAVLASALAGLGVYSVLSHLVAQRSREMGLRRALGASDRQVVREILFGGMRDAGVGALAGLGLGWLITRNLSALLFEVRPGDPLVFILVAVGFLTVALVACWIPARRATRSDPVMVLRGE